VPLSPDLTRLAFFGLTFQGETKVKTTVNLQYAPFKVEVRASEVIAVRCNDINNVKYTNASVCYLVCGMTCTLCTQVATVCSSAAQLGKHTPILKTNPRPKTRRQTEGRSLSYVPPRITSNGACGTRPLSRYTDCLNNCHSQRVLHFHGLDLKHASFPLSLYALNAKSFMSAVESYNQSYWF
jgi:hypothetical protein